MREARWRVEFTVSRFASVSKVGSLLLMVLGVLLSSPLLATSWSSVTTITSVGDLVDETGRGFRLTTALAALPNYAPCANASSGLIIAGSQQDIDMLFSLALAAKTNAIPARVGVDDRTCDNGYPRLVAIRLGSQDRTEPAPIASLPNVTGIVGTALSIQLNSHISDPKNDALAISVMSGVPGVTTYNAATGNLTGTPTNAGIFQVVVRVNDGNNGITVATFNVTVSQPGDGGSCNDCHR